MTLLIALYIIGAILLLFAFILLLRAEVVIAYSDELSLTVRVLGIGFKILPKKTKKVRLYDYSPKKRAKYEKAQTKKTQKKAKKKAEKKARKEKKKEEERAERDAGKTKPKRPLDQTISMITELVGTAVRRFGKHLRVRIARLHIAVATGDAASTAILYGIIAQSVCYLAAILDSTSTLKNPAKSDVDIHADYLAEKISADIEIGFAISVWQLFDVLLRSGFKLVQYL